MRIEGAEESTTVLPQVTSDERVTIEGILFGLIDPNVGGEYFQNLTTEQLLVFCDSSKNQSERQDRGYELREKDGLCYDHQGFYSREYTSKELQDISHKVMLLKQKLDEFFGSDAGAGYKDEQKASIMLQPSLAAALSGGVDEYYKILASYPKLRHMAGNTNDLRLKHISDIANLSTSFSIVGSSEEEAQKLLERLNGSLLIAKTEVLDLIAKKGGADGFTAAIIGVLFCCSDRELVSDDEFATFLGTQFDLDKVETIVGALFDYYTKASIPKDSKRLEAICIKFLESGLLKFDVTNLDYISVIDTFFSIQGNKPDHVKTLKKLIPLAIKEYAKRAQGLEAEKDKRALTSEITHFLEIFFVLNDLNLMEFPQLITNGSALTDWRTECCASFVSRLGSLSAEQFLEYRRKIYDMSVEADLVGIAGDAEGYRKSCQLDKVLVVMDKYREFALEAKGFQQGMSSFVRLTKEINFAEESPDEIKEKYNKLIQQYRDGALQLEDIRKSVWSTRNLSLGYSAIGAATTGLGLGLTLSATTSLQNVAPLFALAALSLGVGAQYMLRMLAMKGRENHLMTAADLKITQPVNEKLMNFAPTTLKLDM